jgi:hypothetical protein
VRQEQKEKVKSKKKRSSNRGAEAKGKSKNAKRSCHFERSEKSKIPHIRSFGDDILS